MCLQKGRKTEADRYRRSTNEWGVVKEGEEEEEAILLATGRNERDLSKARIALSAFLLIPLLFSPPALRLISHFH